MYRRRSNAHKGFLPVTISSGFSCPSCPLPLFFLFPLHSSAPPPQIAICFLCWAIYLVHIKNVLFPLPRIMPDTEREIKKCFWERNVEKEERGRKRGVRELFLQPSPSGLHFPPPRSLSRDVFSLQISLTRNICVTVKTLTFMYTHVRTHIHLHIYFKYVCLCI